MILGEPSTKQTVSGGIIMMLPIEHQMPLKRIRSTKHKLQNLGTCKSIARIIKPFIYPYACIVLSNGGAAFAGALEICQEQLSRKYPLITESNVNKQTGTTHLADIYFRSNSANAAREWVKCTKKKFGGLQGLSYDLAGRVDVKCGGYNIDIPAPQEVAIYDRNGIARNAKAINITFDDSCKESSGSPKMESNRIKVTGVVWGNITYQVADSEFTFQMRRPILSIFSYEPKAQF